MPHPSGIGSGRDGLSGWTVRVLPQAGKGGPSGDTAERGSLDGPSVASISLRRDPSAEPPT